MQGTFLSYLSKICVHFQQYFHFYASYDPDFLLTQRTRFGEPFGYLEHVRTVH
eukprot:UN15912